jgi:predicted nucleic acid-binding protein
MTDFQVFLDANAILYAFDETSPHFLETVATIQRLQRTDTILCTSHHVIEEVVHVMRKAGVTAVETIQTIATIPNLVLVEPDAILAFAERYAKLSDNLNMGINDALLLQLIIDTDIKYLFSYDKQFINRAAELGIQQIA